MKSEQQLSELEFLANKVLEGHHVRTGYDLAPIILELVAEVRTLQAEVSNMRKDIIREHQG